MWLRTDQMTPLKQALADEERSCAWLGRKVGVSRGTAHRWAEGLHEPDESNKRRVAAALRRDLDTLFPPDADAQPLRTAA